MYRCQDATKNNVRISSKSEIEISAEMQCHNCPGNISRSEQHIVNARKIVAFTTRLKINSTKLPPLEELSGYQVTRLSKPRVGV